MNRKRKLFFLSLAAVSSLFAKDIDIDYDYNSYEIPKYLHSSTNYEAMKLLKLPLLWKEPYNLSGEGVKIAVVDWGKVRVTHQEFQKDGRSRIHIMGEENQRQPYHPHATFLTGTIAAKGVNPKAKGAAENVEIYSYYAPEYNYSRAVLKAYKDEGITLSNHAYLYVDPQYDGVYDEEAKALDKVVYDNPYLNVFMAGGNDRGHEGESNYKQLKGPRNAKNVFTIAATMDNGDMIAPYSNRGPVNDGRIKPDFAVAGAGNSYLLSTGAHADDEYIVSGGTTSATARAIGSAALILEFYKRLTGKDKIRHDILKSLFINTATDRGPKGPDYMFGFGTINPKDAVDTLWTLISKKPLVQTGEVAKNEVKKYEIDMPNDGTLKITLVWIDPPGPAEIPNLPDTRKPTLINDLDMWIERDGERFYPFSLDGENVEKPATAVTFNKVDNVEQIVIENAKKGKYKVFIKAARLKTPSQKYAIVSSNYAKPITSLIKNGVDNFVERYYEYILDRKASKEEIDFWKDKLKEGSMSALDVAEFFFESPEYKSQNDTVKEFLTKVYRVMLNREPDKEGFGYWLNRIKNKTTSKDLIVYEFGLSDEFKKLCDNYSITPFNEDNKIDFFIKRLYIIVLGRDYDPKGLSDWKNFIKTGKESAAEVTKNFFFSDEFKNRNLTNEEFVKVAYLAILGKEADSDEVEYWTSKLDMKNITREKLLDEFLNSDEFKGFIKKYKIER